MKFGREYHLHRVPEWDRFYIDYNGLKRMIKLLRRCGEEHSFAALYDLISENISLLEEFRKKKGRILFEHEVIICSQFGLPPHPVSIPHIDAVYHLELAFIWKFYEYLRKELSKLQWFDRVNDEAVSKILVKLEQCHQSGARAREHIKSRWLETMTATASALSDASNRLSLLSSTITEALSSSKPPSLSLYFSRVLEKIRGSSSEFDGLAQALASDNANAVAEILTPQVLGLSFQDVNFQRIIRETLLCAFIYKSKASFLSLLENADSVLDRDRNYLHFLTQVAGISGGADQDHRRAESSSPGTLSNSNLFDTSSILGLTLEKLGRRANAMLLQRDHFGCIPLHYAAKYGSSAIFEKFVEVLQKSATPRQFAESIMSPDDEGIAPLQYAVVVNFVHAVKLCLGHLQESHVIEQTQYMEFVGDLLLLAIRYQHDNIVHQIISGVADLRRKSSCGETALYLAAQLGKTSYVEHLLRNSMEQEYDIDQRENAFGWTPLLVSCANGHKGVVELLLKAGACQDLTDHLGWSAREHASFRGHFDVAEILQVGENTVFEGGPATKLAKQEVCSHIHCEMGEEVIIMNMGSTQNRDKKSAVNFQSKLSQYISGALALEISIPSSHATANGTAKQCIKLPLLTETSVNSLSFPIKQGLTPQLTFKIFRPRGSDSQKQDLFGSGTAVLDVGIQLSAGTPRESLIREQTVAILDSETMEMMGTIIFTYVVARPFPHLQEQRPVKVVRAKGDTVVLVGHRGAGQNVASQEHLQLGENTFESFLYAYKLGAPFVEFDLQITRDLEAVVYHDLSLSESGTDVPIHDVTLEQYLYAGDVQSPHRRLLSTTADNTNSRGTHSKQRSRSFGHAFETGATEMQNHVRHTVDFKAKGLKPNTRGMHIHGSFTTLDELLRDLPAEIGLNIEFKHPRIHVTMDAGVAPVAIEINTFIDVALDKIHKLAGDRQLFFSSFTPEICILLSMKQRAYPVMFITNAGKPPLKDLEMRTASLQVAVKFAKRWNLAGIVFASEVFVLSPRLIKFVKNSGLACGSYGALNQVPEYLKLQARAGIDVMVADRVGSVAQILKETT